MEEIAEGLKWFALIWAAISMLKFLLSLKGITFSLCERCITFWAVLLFTVNPFIAAISSFFYHIWDSKFNTIKL